MEDLLLHLSTLALNIKELLHHSQQGDGLNGLSAVTLTTLSLLLALRLTRHGLEPQSE